MNQIENHAAKQIREQGYCEVILTGETREKLRENLLDLEKRFPTQSEEAFFETAMKMLETY